MDDPYDVDDTTEDQAMIDDDDFLLRPDLPEGFRVQLSGVVSAQGVTSDWLQRLGSVMMQLQRASSIPGKPACGKLRRCGSFRGGCPNLSHCGTYAPPGTPTV